MNEVWTILWRIIDDGIGLIVVLAFLVSIFEIIFHGLQVPDNNPGNDDTGW